MYPDSTRSAGTGTSRLRFALLPGTSGLRLKIGGFLVKPQVRGAEGQTLGHPETGAQHYAHGHADLVTWSGRHQRESLIAVK